MLTVSANAQTEIDATGSQPVWLFELDLASAGTQYLTDEDGITVSGQAYTPAVCSWGNIKSTVNLRDGRVSTDSVTIALQNTDDGGAGTLWSTTFESDDPVGRQARIYLWYKGLTSADKVEKFRGYVTEIAGGWGDSKDTVELVIEGMTSYLDAPVGRVINKTDFPNAPDSAIGQMLPIVYGKIEQYGKAICIDDNDVTGEAWTYAVAGHAVKAIDAVYINNNLVDTGYYDVNVNDTDESANAVATFRFDTDPAILAGTGTTSTASEIVRPFEADGANDALSPELAFDEEEDVATYAWMYSPSYTHLYVNMPNRGDTTTITSVKLCARVCLRYQLVSDTVVTRIRKISTGTNGDAHNITNGLEASQESTMTFYPTGISSANGNWSNPSYAVDGNAGTYAQATDSSELVLYAPSAPRGGIITKVQGVVTSISASSFWTYWSGSAESIPSSGTATTTTVTVASSGYGWDWDDFDSDTAADRVRVSGTSGVRKIHDLYWKITHIANPSTTSYLYTFEVGTEISNFLKDWANYTDCQLRVAYSNNGDYAAGIQKVFVQDLYLRVYYEVTTPEVEKDYTVTCSLQGYQDTSAGKYTGIMPDALIEKPPDVIAHFLETYAGVTWTDIDVSGTGSFEQAKSSLDSDAYKFAGCIARQESAMSIVARMASECRSWVYCEGGTWKMAYRADSLGAADKSFSEDDYVPGGMVISRQRLDEVINRVLCYYSRDWSKSESEDEQLRYTETVQTDDVTSQSAYGVRAYGYEKSTGKINPLLLDFLRAVTPATDLTNFVMDRWSSRKRIITSTHLLPAVTVERGDIVEHSYDTFGISDVKAEVIETSTIPGSGYSEPPPVSMVVITAREV